MRGKALLRAKDVRIGVAYDVIIAGRQRSVRIDCLESPGIWLGTNLSNHRRVYVALADLLRVSVLPKPCVEYARAAAGDLL